MYESLQDVWRIEPLQCVGANRSTGSWLRRCGLEASELLQWALVQTELGPRRTTMLARLPTELLLHNVLCYLPKKDLLALLRTSKVLAAVATELIDPEARCTTPEQCDALCSRLLADSQSGARLRHLRRLDICCIDLATDELLHLLQGAHDVVHLVINNKLYAHAPTRNSICSMHGLKSLTLINHPADVATYPFPSQIEEMRIFAYSMDPTDYGPFVLALSELANLHTLDLRIDDMPNSFGRGMPVISSVNHLSLHIFNEQRKLSFPMILRLFPHVSMLPLRLRMMMYLRADKDNHRVLTVRLQRLDMPYMGTQHTSTRLACLQLNWLDFCDDACNADPDDMIPTLKIVSGFCCKGYPLGVTLLKPTVLGERLWQDVASVTPSLRWLWVDNPDEPDGLPKHVPVKSIVSSHAVTIHQVYHFDERLLCRLKLLSRVGTVPSASLSSASASDPPSYSTPTP